MAERIGQQVGNYLLTRFLGRGGFGEVYLGEHGYLRTAAAIKFLLGEMIQHDWHEFLREAQIIASLKHPYILRVLDFGLHQNQLPFLVMEYATLGSLRDRHPRGTRLPVPTVLSYIKQIGSALDYAHKANLIHCDVKPENMLSANEQYVLLTDFGIAAVVQNTESIHALDPAGTPPYMAPEQFLGLPQQSSDQYALGIVAYEWLCGERPFSGDSLVEIGRAHAEMPLPSLCEKNPGIPVEIEQVLEVALTKDPQQRFPSVQAFVDAFEKVCNATLTTDKLSLAGNTRQQFADAETARQISSWGNKQDLPNEANPVVEKQTEANAPSPVQSQQITPTAPIAPVTTRNRTIHTTNSRGALLQSYQGHRGGAQVVAFAPDGQHFASGSLDAIIHIRNVATGELVQSYTHHNGAIHALVWSPDGQYLASGSADQTVQVWQAMSGQRVHTYTNHAGAIAALSWSPDGNYLASSSWDKTVQIWYALNGTILRTLTGYTDRVHALAWATDSQRLALSSSDETVQVWYIPSGKLRHTYTGHTNYIHSLAWSPDGKYLVSGSWDRTVQVWEPVTSHCFCTYSNHTFLVQEVAWSPDGTLIASASWDKTVHIWNALTGAPISVYAGHAKQVNSLAWSPDGQTIISADNDSIQHWQLVDHSVRAIYQDHLAHVDMLSWSPDGHYLASLADGHNVQVWEAATGNQLLTYSGHQGPVHAFDWSPDGKLLASCSTDQSIQIWQALSGTRVQTYNGTTENGQPNAITAIKWSHDGQHLAAGYTNGTIEILQAQTGTRVMTYIGHHRDVTALAWSRHKSHIVSASSSQIQVWDAFSGERLHSHDHDPYIITAVAWSPDSEAIVYATISAATSFSLLTGSTHNSTKKSGVQLWNLHFNNHKPLQAGDTSTLAWSPGGDYLATSERNLVHLRDAHSGKLLYSYYGHVLGDKITALAWSPDGKRIASGCYGIQIWQAN